MQIQKILNIFKFKRSQPNAYIKDINRAINNGSIKIMPSQRKDPFSHLKELDIFNTRPLSDNARAIVKFIGAKKSTVSCLELGAGAGHASYDIYRTALDSGFKADIDLVALTPIAPRFGLLKKRRQIPLIYYEMTGKEIYELTPDQALDLQKQGAKIFDKLDHDYIRKQYIGIFSDMDINEQYDFILDSYGAFYHSVLVDSCFKVVNKTLSLLKPDGFFYAESDLSALDNSDYIFSCIDKLGYFCLTIHFKNSVLVFKKESLFHKKIEKIIDREGMTVSPFLFGRYSFAELIKAVESNKID